MSYGDWYGGDPEEDVWREEAWQSIREAQDEWAERQIEIEDQISMGRPKIVQPELRTGGYGELVPSFGFSRASHAIAAVAPLRSSAWVSHDGLVVFSSMALAQLPGAPEGQHGPQWVVSVSRQGRERPSPEDALRVVAGFGMPSWEEDNHHPGVARHLWLPCDPAFRNQCECKLTETVITDGDYEWTNDDRAPCRGCQLQALTRQLGFERRCPIHSGEVVVS